MVAITVILAAVIGTTVLNIGQENANSAPQASLSVSVDVQGDTMSLAHTGGDRLASTTTRLVISNDSGTSVTFDPLDDGPALGVGDTAVFAAKGPNQDTVDWDGDGTVDYRTPDRFDSINDGDSLTVRVIDVETERIIFETRVIAHAGQ